MFVGMGQATDINVRKRLAPRRGRTRLPCKRS
jgi:hypothetical protein